MAIIILLYHINHTMFLFKIQVNPQEKNVEGKDKKKIVYLPFLRNVSIPDSSSEISVQFNKMHQAFKSTNQILTTAHDMLHSHNVLLQPKQHILHPYYQRDRPKSTIQPKVVECNFMLKFQCEHYINIHVSVLYIFRKFAFK